MNRSINNSIDGGSRCHGAYRSAFFLLLFLSFSFLITSQARAQGIVVDIAVQGNHRIDTEIILNAIYTTKGKVYSREAVSEDVKRIYKLGFFEDVGADKSSAPGGVKLTYEVKERPPIEEVVIEGNKKIKKSKIKEIITVKPNQPPSNKQIAESKAKIKQLYASEGYDRAVVETQTRVKGGKRQLVFKINEKEGSIVRGVRFEGNTVFSDRKLRGMIKTKKKSFISFLTGSGKYREDILERDVAFITYHYLNKGYVRVRVGQPKVEFSSKKKGLILTFYIDEGQQYRVGDISFSGDMLTTKEEILKDFDTLKVGAMSFSSTTTSKSSVKMAPRPSFSFFK